jgi:hypothetical protein
LSILHSEFHSTLAAHFVGNGWRRKGERRHRIKHWRKIERRNEVYAVHVL